MTTAATTSRVVASLCLINLQPFCSDAGTDSWPGTRRARLEISMFVPAPLRSRAT
jgi:hypothetical protein